MPLTADELIPDAATRERIFREACVAVARERDAWLNYDEAAAYIRRSKRELYRIIKATGLPVNQLTKTVLRADLDALLLAHVTRGQATVINFPSTSAAAKAA